MVASTRSKRDSRQGRVAPKSTVGLIKALLNGCLDVWSVQRGDLIEVRLCERGSTHSALEIPEAYIGSTDPPGFDLFRR